MPYISYRSKDTTQLMATRARIGYKIPGTSAIISVYHHWDGYPSFLGKKLVEEYATDSVVRELINLGDMSRIESDRDWNGKKMPPATPLTYASRGDDNIEPTLSESLEEFCEEGVACWAEYVYLYDEGFWSCYTVPNCTLTNI